MTKTDYYSYSSTDFLEDHDFLRFVKYNLPQDISFWESWMNTNPSNIEEFEMARFQLSGILGDEPRTVQADFENKLWVGINKAIDQAEQKEHRSKLRTYIASGSVAVIAITIGVLWYFNSTIVISTKYGESIVANLPDGSKVRLNANSELSYPRSLNWRDSRVVEVKGEAFFSVKHLNSNPSNVKKGEAFIANTKDVQVQVLGTEFNLRERRGNVNIALLQGKVKVMIHKTGMSYTLSPGASINYNGDGSIDHLTDNAQMQSAWMSGKIVVRQTTVNEIIQSFQDLYGYKIILEDPAMGFRKIDGEISIRSEESLLFTLKNILNVDIDKKNNTIYLKNRR